MVERPDFYLKQVEDTETVDVSKGFFDTKNSPCHNMKCYLSSLQIPNIKSETLVHIKDSILQINQPEYTDGLRIRLSYR